MVSAKGLSYANEKTRHLLRLAPGEDQVAVQLFGHEPDTMAAQAAWIEREMGQSLAYLDINMGCPARKIVSKGDGSALMKDPALAASIVRAVRAAVSRPEMCIRDRVAEARKSGVPGKYLGGAAFSCPVSSSRANAALALSS